MSFQNSIEYIKDQLQQNKITLDEANVLLVKAEGVRIVHGKMPRQIRQVLNLAVKNGEIGHFKKDGFKPECYFNNNSIGKAKEIRNEKEKECLYLLSKVYAPNNQFNI